MLDELVCGCGNLAEITLKYELLPSPNRQMYAGEILSSIQDKMQKATLGGDYLRFGEWVFVVFHHLYSSYYSSQLHAGSPGAGSGLYF